LRGTPLYVLLGAVGIVAAALGSLIFGWERGVPQFGEDARNARPSAAAPGPDRPAAENGQPAQTPPAFPTFDVVRVAPDGKAVIAGRAEPGSNVTVKDGDAVIGTTNADQRGEWVLLPEKPLEPGTRHLSLQARRSDGKVVDSEGFVIVVIPPRDETLPPEEREPPVVVLLPRGEGGGSRLLQGPRVLGDTSAAKGLSLDTVDYDEKGNLLLSGKAAPNAPLRAYLDNKEIGGTVADGQGLWRLQPTEKVAPGKATLRVDHLAPDGKVLARIELPFSRAEPSTIKLAAGQVVVQPGNSLWRIARAIYGEGPQFTVIYQANREQIRDADLIYPGQIFAVPKR